MDTDRIKEIEQAFDYIASRYGDDILQNPNRFYALLSDFVPELERERKLVKAAVDAGAYQAMYQAGQQNDAAKAQCIKSCLAVLTNQFWIKEDGAKMALAWFARVMRWDETWYNALTDPSDGWIADQTSRLAAGTGFYDRLRSARERAAQVGQLIAAGNRITAGVRADGRLTAVGDNSHGQLEVKDWRNMVAVAAGGGHTVGLCADGTVSATGYNRNGQCAVDDWQDIVAIAAGNQHTVGLHPDGTVVMTGGIVKHIPASGKWRENVASFLDKLNDRLGRGTVNTWQDVAAIAAGYWHTVGLRADGTVISAGYNNHGQCNVGAWRDIAAVSAGDWHTVGLRADGTVIATGGIGQGDVCDVGDWQDIVAIACGSEHTVGLRENGTVVATGDDQHGRCNVSTWRNIVAIAAGSFHTVGLCADGTVVSVGDALEDFSGRLRLFHHVDTLKSEWVQARQKLAEQDAARDTALRAELSRRNTPWWA